jgi:hypothetical protein
MAINLNKTWICIVPANDRPDGVKRLTKYLHTCDVCKCERGYFIKTFDKCTKNGGLCRSCAAKLAPPKTTEARKKISKARIGKSTWHGTHSDKTKNKMRQAALNRDNSCRKGLAQSEETKRKISCARRKINLVDFDGFLTEEDDAQRRLFKSQGLHWQCFERADYSCDCCNRKRTTENTLNAHHLNGWNWSITERFDLLNLVALCENCHIEFHKMHGKGQNTKKQYEEFKCQKQKHLN